MTVSQTLVPSTTIGKDVAFIAGGAALTALCAQVSIPFEPVPITLQTLAVGVCGLTLGTRRGAASQLAYLGAGACGLPVFANFKGGFPVLLGHTAGYLWAFVLAAALLGFLAERGWDRKVLPCAVALTFGNLLILGIGTAWLSVFIGGVAAITAGFTPFIAGAVIKSAATMLALPTAWRFKSDATPE